MPSDKKYCPLLNIGLPVVRNKCGREECAWWDTDEEECVVLLLANLSYPAGIFEAKPLAAITVSKVEEQE
jgi:hypothetical protein